MSPGGDRGSVTAEFAITLPAVLLILGLCLAGVQLGTLQVRLQDSAADAARSLGRGEPVATAAAGASAQVPGARLIVSSRGELRCARIVAAADAVGGLLDIELGASSCAMGGGR
jgi:hypothetical protein